MSLDKMSLDSRWLLPSLRIFPVSRNDVEQWIKKEANMMYGTAPWHAKTKIFSSISSSVSNGETNMVMEINESINGYNRNLYQTEMFLVPD